MLLAACADTDTAPAGSIETPERQDPALATPSEASEPADAASSGHGMTSGLGEMVASGMERGDLSCPEGDSVTYEACLLYQGTLGVWQRLGLNDTCPEVGGGELFEGDARTSDLPVLTPAVAKRAVRSSCFGYLYAIGVANTVPILSSTANRNFHLTMDENLVEPGSDPEICLQVRRGSCGNQTAVGLGLFERAGFTARPVEFYYTMNGDRQSHIVPEVLIDGRWRMIDTTYGAYWATSTAGDPFALLSTQQIIKDAQAPETWNDALRPYGVYDAVGSSEPFAYLTNDPQVVRGGVGTITIDIDTPAGEDLFHHLPNFVGDNLPDGSSQGLDYRFTGATEDVSAVTVKVAGSAIAGDAPASLCIDDTCEPYSNDRDQYDFAVSKPNRMYLQSDAEVAYLVLASVSWN